MLYRILVLLLAIIIWALLYFTGNDTHAADGIIFFGLVAAEAVLIFFQGRTTPGPQ